MKFCSPILITIFSFLILSPLNIFACACCADEGFYKISVRKPDGFLLSELKKLKFGDAEIYSTAGFPNNIKGLNPIESEYKVVASANTDGWEFTFTDPNGKSGTLELKAPNDYVEFGVDLRNGKRGGAGSVELYKEWRFKYRVNKASGIFKDSIKGKAEYFLVFQGKGNVCTSAEDFTDWRLEVMGKNSNYAFYGSMKKDEIPEITISEKFQPPAKRTSQFISVAGLTATDYSGCGCSGWIEKDQTGINKNRVFWTEFKSNSDDETLFINLDGIDSELKIVSKGNRPETEKVGDKFTDEYEANGTKVILEYTTKKLPYAKCEGTDYEVTATIIGEYSGKVVSLAGTCGC